MCSRFAGGMRRRMLLFAYGKENLLRAGLVISGGKQTAENPIPASRLVLIARRSQPAHSLAETRLATGNLRHANLVPAKPRVGGLWRTIRAARGDGEWTCGRCERSASGRLRSARTGHVQSEGRKSVPRRRSCAFFKGAGRADRAPQPARTRFRRQPSRPATARAPVRRNLRTVVGQARDDKPILKPRRCSARASRPAGQI